MRNIKKNPVENYLLILYVSGSTPRSLAAIKTIREICEEHLNGRYLLKIIDIYQQPALAKDDQIVAVPTLIKRLPGTLRRLIGDFSDRKKVLFGLNLRPVKNEKE